MTQNVPNSGKLPINEFKIKLVELIQLVGAENLNLTQLEREYGYMRKTIRKYICSILSSIPAKELAKERVKAYHAFIGMNKELGRLKLQHRDNPDIMVKLIDAERKVLDTQVKVHEAYMLKDKVADKIDVNWKEEIKKLVKPAKLKWGEGGFRPADEK